MGLFPGIVASDAVGGPATGRSGQLAVGGSAECRHHMTVRGRGTAWRNAMARCREDIFWACSRGDKDAVSRIISAGIDPKQVRNPNWFGETLLHNASRYVMLC